MKALVAVAMLSLTLNACVAYIDHGGSSESDVTSDFLAKTSGRIYTEGGGAPASGPTRLSIFSDGTEKTEYNDMDCPYVVTSRIDKVVKNDESHFTITTTNVSVEATANADTVNCQKFISDFKFTHIPETNSVIVCGYSADVINRSCDGRTGGWSNWVGLGSRF